MNMTPENDIVEIREADTLLRIALDVGEGMLKSGGEINRVESTIEIIRKAYGAEHVEIFAIPSVLIGAIRMKNGEYSSQVRRIDGTENHLYRLELFNAISRKICREKPSFEIVDQMIYEAKHRKSYPMFIRAIAAAIAAGVFALFFGGTIKDGLVAAIIGVVIFLIDIIPMGQINKLAKTVIQSFIGGGLACLFVKIGVGDDIGMIMIGTIMLLIPGVSFGTAFRDLMCGDFLAGTLKTVQCILAALMIAAGYLLSMFVMGGIA
ncbi:MAG: threonine/serine exporter family protein [Clostridia bacterium]|nr:threonine/serine exporter family protein [Clostridia bacterium]